MSITVSPTTRSTVSVSSQQSQASLTVKKASGSTLQSLSNVVTTDLQDGYTLVYDADLGKWVARELSAAVTTVLDGGTY